MERFLKMADDRPAFEEDRESSLWYLAERLFDVEERLDPGYRVSWESLTDLERDYFYSAVKAVLLERSHLLRVLEINPTDHDMIVGGLGLRKESDVHND